MSEQNDPIVRIGNRYARFYPALLLAFVVLSASPVFAVGHGKRGTTDDGTLYNMAILLGEGPAIMRLLIFFVLLAALAGAAIWSHDRILPGVCAVVALIVMTALANMRPAADPAAALSSTASMATFLCLATAVFNVVHVIHLSVATRRLYTR